MNQLQIFNYQTKEVRTVIKNGEPWFVAKDVCEILEHSNSRVAISRLEEDEKGVSKVYTLGGEQELTVINEFGLYSLVLTSNKPEAKQFKRWITHEVIPSIRQHGTYMTPDFVESALSNPDTMITFLQKYKEEQQKRIEAENQIEAQKPKVVFADAVSISKTSILIGDLAKLIKQNGYEIGQKRLFKWLRENGYLMQHGESYNMPTQKSMQLGLFEVKEGTVINPDDSVRITKTTKVTGKGQIYFINKFVEKSA
jgi:anti-repressor protein